jgi:glycosyltransferase involved in cell wall biosynthesis
MRFLCVSDFLPERSSGAAGSILAIGEALTRLGHDVDYRWHEERPFHLPHAALQRHFELPRRQLAQVEAALSVTPYDVVIVSQPYAYLVYERLAPRYPDTLFLNRTHGWEARLYEARRAYAWDGRVSPARGAASRIGVTLARHACRRTATSCQGLVSPASPCARWVREHYPIDPDAVAVITYGLDPTFLSALAHPSEERSARHLLFVGNYLTRKGTRILDSTLPQLAARYPDVRLTFVVDAEGAPQVERAYRPAFGERLALRSWADREELLPVYREHDILLFPSLFEGFGKTWFEAMATGLCVVGFTEGGLSDVARHGEHALLAPPGDAAAFGTLLAQALEDPKRTHALGARARERVQAYTWEGTAEQTVAFCERVRARGS